MAIHISLNGNSAGDGFLIAPLATTYEAEIALWTDAGTPTVTLQASPNPANLVFSTAGPFNLTTVPTVYATVHSQLQSASRGDTTIQVLEGTTVVASFNITSIKQPVVNFSGRFEARFSTDNLRPYLNPIYQPPPAPDLVFPLNYSMGTTFGLEGEPNFVPITGTVPTNLDMIGVGRNVRLNNPVALRSHAAPVVSTVVSISGQTTGATETFTAGDPLIGQPVNFGPDTYMAGNNDGSNTAGSPAPEECWAGGNEPLALFEINIGAAFSPPAIYFRGASQVGPFTHIATHLNETTRTPDSRPKGAGEIPAPATGYTAFGIPPDAKTFTKNRLSALLADYAGLPPGPSLARRNLVRRIGHLLGYLQFSETNPPDGPDASLAAVISNAQAQAVAPDVFTIRMGTDKDAWLDMEQFQGKVDTALHAWPGGSPGASSVVAYMTQFFSFDFHWVPFAFHTDENCGYHTGTLSGDLSMTGNHIGDPHVHTVDGTPYDFQSVGEFTLLRGYRMEIQVRQWPVPTANPVSDAHSGLISCVSINTAVAVRMGEHRIALQQERERQRLEFYVDGKPAEMPANGIELGGSRVTAFAASGETGIRVDFEDGTVVLITPTPWFANIWYLNVSVSNTSADEGVMGFIPKGSWLPRLRNGVDVGPRPASLHDRYVTLYKTFADSWRVTDKTSLFVYAPGTSTRTFTDRDWPAEKLPCKLKPEFRIPGVKVHQGMPIERAEMICRVVIDKNLYKNCVFDVATTGDKTFAKGYAFAEEIRLYSTLVKIGCYQGPSRPYRSSRVPPKDPDEREEEEEEKERERHERTDVPAQNSVVVTATVAPLTPGRPIPTGTVTVYIDGVPMNRPAQLDDRGRARVRITSLKPGEHKIRATYSGGGKFDYHSSSSSTHVCTVGSEEVRQAQEWGLGRRSSFGFPRSGRSEGRPDGQVNGYIKLAQKVGGSCEQSVCKVELELLSADLWWTQFSVMDLDSRFLEKLDATLNVNRGLGRLSRALQLLLERFDCTTGTVHLLDDESGMLKLAAQHGIPDSVLDKIKVIPVGKGMAGIAAERREPVQVCNLQTDRSGVVRPGARDTKMEGSLAAPMLNADGMLKGTLGVAKPIAYDFTPQQCDLVMKAGRRIADRL